MKKIATFFLYFVALFGLQVLISPQTQALSDSFNAGNIIDDATFTNKSSMSVAAIQRFFESKVTNCDTYGQQLSEFGGPDLNGDGRVQRWEWGKSKYNQTTFPCIKDYRENDGRSAAQVIYDVAQKYNINPQVFIVLLQKEQGLITDTWPLFIQYRSATGYGCPDTAPCDSQYYGLVNQLDWSGKMFRSILNNSPSWYTPYVLGNNFIRYNPDTSCGGSTVYITNRSTQALYNYTPYQPNTATIAAGWGSAPCGAYGNLRFWQYFKSWFDNPTLFRINNGYEVFFRSGTDYYRVPSELVLNAYGYGFGYESNLSNTNGLTFKGVLSDVMRFEGSDDIYLVDNGVLHKFTSANDFRAYGYTFGDENDLDIETKDNLSISTNMSSIARIAGADPVYYINNKTKAHISSSSVYTTQSNPIYSTRPVVELTNTYLNNRLTTVRPILESNSYITDSSKSKLYFWETDTLIQIDSTVISSYKINANPYVASTEALAALNPSPVTLKGFVINSSGVAYVIDSQKKYQVSNALYNQLTAKNIVPQYISDALLNKYTPASYPEVIRFGLSDPVYKTIDGELWQYASRQDLEADGYTVSGVVSVQSSFGITVKNSNNYSLPKGKVLRINNGDKVFIAGDPLRIHWIQSKELLYRLGYKFTDVVNVTDGKTSRYQEGTPMTTVLSDNGYFWFIDGNSKWIVPNSLLSAYGAASGTVLSNYSVLTSTRHTLGTLTAYIRVQNEDTVYKLINGIRHPFSSRASFEGEGVSWDQIKSLSSDAVLSFPVGPQI